MEAADLYNRALNMYQHEETQSTVKTVNNTRCTSHVRPGSCLSNLYEEKNHHNVALTVTNLTTSNLAMAEADTALPI